MKQTGHVRPVHRDAAPVQFHAQFVERQIAILGHPLAHEVGMSGQLAAARAVALPARLKRTSLGAQLHQIVHELRRNPEMTRRLTIAQTPQHAYATPSVTACPSRFSLPPQ
ncbi:transposase [Mesorhizobium sp. VK24D]|uniref:Transposase n=1 Tax=Mesorhizobium album TaxID=3072314 RepID=A0ABU4Y8P7_9HYPH|nr:transposase [Mesorhizobium sp. VK24D]MDX8483313.1 transposase [Mesorhizobium sp. VK24D]